MRAGDVDHNAMRIEGLGQKCHADHGGRTMQFLRWPENLAPEGMGDHYLLGGFDRVHESLSPSVKAFSGKVDGFRRKCDHKESGARCDSTIVARSDRGQDIR
jgi:hypothetical protein